jgi:5-methylcytosine-specific restriction protein B
MFIATQNETLNILIPENITKEHLLKAIEEIDRGGIRPGRHSSTYDLIYRGKAYPPKLVISIANKFANGEELDHNSFSGGTETPAFNHLKSKGFTVKKKSLLDLEGLDILKPQMWIEKTLVKGRKDREQGERELGKALWSPQQDKRGADIYKNMRQVNEGDLVLHLVDNSFFESVSIVENKAIKTNGISGTDWEGPAFLISLKNNKKFKNPILKELVLSSEHERDLIEISESSEVFYTKKMTLRQGAYLTPCTPQLLSIINREYKKITEQNLPNFKGIDMKEHKKYFSIEPFSNALSLSNLLFNDNLKIRFIASLLTKPFVLLSGLSGSGKTKLAEAFVMWMCQDESQYKLVPVGADWTNREPLLGFPNALDAGEYVHPDNGVLQLVMNAQANQDRPYFLILDEMNLSHVERYFADFLSTMESSEAEIQLHDNDKIKNNPENPIPKKLNLPKNLFIIGTVNIDETTYMFSPKVLDRANTIEFRVTKDEIEGFFKAPKDIDLDIIKAKGASMAASFLKMSLSKEITASQDAKDELVSFFEDLQKTGAEFGYRTANEMVKLITNLEKLGVDNEDESIDIAIMQKMLPKLNGSRRKLSKVLISLGTKCLKDKSVNVETEYFAKEEADLSDVTKVKYPLSFEKITRMYRNARDNGFASYAEA